MTDVTDMPVLDKSITEELSCHYHVMVQNDLASTILGMHRISGFEWPDIRLFFYYPVPFPAQLFPETG